MTGDKRGITVGTYVAPVSGKVAKSHVGKIGKVVGIDGGGQFVRIRFPGQQRPVVYLPQQLAVQTEYVEREAQDSAKPKGQAARITSLEVALRAVLEGLVIVRETLMMPEASDVALRAIDDAIATARSEIGR